MKILLKDESARLYYGPNDSWAGDPAAATDFQALETAVEHAFQCPAQTLVVVLKVRAQAAMNGRTIRLGER